MKHYLMIMAAMAVVFAVGCGKKPPPPVPDWGSRPKAVTFHCKADPMLNEFGGRSHTLLLVVYQLRSPDFFNKLTQDSDGIKRLLRFERIQERLGAEQIDVLASRRFIINPGETRTITLDRMKDVRGVGVVAGYYHMVPEQVSHYFPLRIIYEKKGLIFFRKLEARAGELVADLEFGPQTLTVKELPTTP